MKYIYICVGWFHRRKTFRFPPTTWPFDVTFLLTIFMHISKSQQHAYYIQGMDCFSYFLSLFANIKLLCVTLKRLNHSIGYCIQLKTNPPSTIKRNTKKAIWLVKTFEYVIYFYEFLMLRNIFPRDDLCQTHIHLVNLMIVVFVFFLNVENN